MNRADLMEILCLATRRLDDPMPTIVQHLMRALAGRIRVLYVEQPVDPVYLARGPRWKMLRPPLGPGQLTRVVPLILPGETHLTSLASINRRLIMAQVRRHLRRWRRGEVLLWVPTPNHAWMADALPDLPLCYYVSDDYTQSPSALAGTTAEAVAEREARLLTRARWVMINSPSMLATKRAATGATHWVPSGVDLGHYRTALDGGTVVPPDLAGIRRPIAGFLGAVDGYKVDFALLTTCARSLPEISFLTIGPVGWIRDGRSVEVPTGPNLHHLGPRPYATLPAYLRGFDVALLPNCTTGYMASNFPMKLFEYFAAGLPVVATDIPSLRPFAPWIRIGRGPEEFIRQVKAALDGPDPRHQQEAQVIATRNSWDRQAARVLDILSGRSPEPVLSTLEGGS